MPSGIALLLLLFRWREHDEGAFFFVLIAESIFTTSTRTAVLLLQLSRPCLAPLFANELSLDPPQHSSFCGIWDLCSRSNVAVVYNSRYCCRFISAERCKQPHEAFATTAVVVQEIRTCGYFTLGVFEAADSQRSEIRGTSTSTSRYLVPEEVLAVEYVCSWSP